MRTVNEVSLKMLISIAQHVKLSDICHWILVAKKYKLALEEELYARALSLDLEIGWPYHLVRAALQNQTTKTFKALLQGTSADYINKCIINLDIIPGNHDWDHLRPWKAFPMTKLMPAPVHTTSLLHIACQMCNRDIVELIIARGAHPNLLDSFEWAPLHLVAWGGKTDIMRILIDAGAEIDIKAQGHQQVHGMRIITEYSETTPLHEAAARGHLSAVEMLLRVGADPKVRCGRGCDALGAAAKRGNVEIVRRLLETGYDKASLTHGLEFAAEAENSSSVEILLQAGAELGDAILSSVVHDRLDNLRLLIEADGNFRNSTHGNILNSVRSFQATKMILINAPGSSAAARPGMSEGTPLEALYEHAQYRQREESEEIEGIAMLFIEDGCPIREPVPINEDNNADTLNRNILEDAALWGHLRVMEAILTVKKSLVNLKHRDGNTPIFYAAYSVSDNKLASFKMLIESGADIHAVNDFGETIMDALYSMSLQRAGTPQPMLQNAAATQHLLDINALPNLETLLINALSTGNDPSAMILIRAGADIKVKSRMKLSTLQLAAQNGCVETMKYLQANGVEF
ncbi:ankyrin repeat-containing domain protein [Xylogone sp. PMI_703]|nr:ankyrin repeat-containing domain protein [Xylogone sp. PMI_703]